MNATTTTGEKIKAEVKTLEETLLAKNSSYGNSAFEAPILFPDSDAATMIGVRMSDKIRRLQHLIGGGKDRTGESILDTLLDLAGYSLLMRILLKQRQADSTKTHTLTER